MAMLRWGLHVAAACFTRPRPPAAGRAAVALAALSPAGADRPGGVDLRRAAGSRARGAEGAGDRRRVQGRRPRKSCPRICRRSIRCRTSSSRRSRRSRAAARKKPEPRRWPRRAADRRGRRTSRSPSRRWSSRRPRRRRSPSSRPTRSWSTSTTRRGRAAARREVPGAEEQPRRGRVARHRHQSAEGAAGRGRRVGEVGSPGHRDRRGQAEDRRARGQEVRARAPGPRRHAPRQPGGRAAGAT